MRAAMNAHRVACGLPPLPKDYDPDVPEPPDIPSCDACGKNFAANLVCSRCQLAWYCGKDCQRVAWKQGGHKAKCAEMKQTCEDMAKAVVTQMANTTAPPVMRVQELDRLDFEGPYRIAQEEHGLHQVMYDMLLEDQRHVLKRFQSKNNLDMACFASWIMTMLFRGGRVSQQARNSTANRFADAYRVKAFLVSKDDALEVWWNASMAFITQVTMDRKIFQRNKALHAEAHNMGRNILAEWSHILTNPKTAKAILYHKNKGDNAKAASRATFLATSTKETLRQLHETRDLQSVLDGYLNRNLAMVDYWCHRWGVDVDIEQVAGLKTRPVERQMYRQMAKPWAEATIQKGSDLTAEETKAALAAGGVEWVKETVKSVCH